MAGKAIPTVSSVVAAVAQTSRSPLLIVDMVNVEKFLLFPKIGTAFTNSILNTPHRQAPQTPGL